MKVKGLVLLECSLLCREFGWAPYHRAQLAADSSPIRLDRLVSVVCTAVHSVSKFTHVDLSGDMVYFRFCRGALV